MSFIMHDSAAQIYDRFPRTFLYKRQQYGKNLSEPENGPFDSDKTMNQISKVADLFFIFAFISRVEELNKPGNLATTRL